MKLLWFGYILLYLTIIYTSLMMTVIAGRVAPGKEIFFFPIVFFTAIGGFGAGLYRLIRLIWLFIAYDPDTEPVPPKKLRLTFTWLALLLVFNGSAHYLTRPPIYKSEITFNDPAIAVQDSMLVLRHIMATADSNRSVNYDVSNQDSTLLFIRPRMNADKTTYGRCGRIDTVTTANIGIRFLKPTDRARTIRLIHFLNRNLISGARYDMTIGFWLFEYGETAQDDFYGGHRELLIYDTPADTLRPAFHYYLKSHNRTQRIVLVSHKRVPYVFFR